MRAGISRGAAKGRKRHDSGPYIHTYILFSACLTTRKFSNESSEDTSIPDGIESPLTPPNLVSGLPLSHTPMPHTNIAILPCRTSQSWQRRGPNGADSPTQLSSARPSTTHQFNHFKSIPYLPQLPRLPLSNGRILLPHFSVPIPARDAARMFACATALLS